MAKKRRKRRRKEIKIRISSLPSFSGEGGALKSFLSVLEGVKNPNLPDFCRFCRPDVEILEDCGGRTPQFSHFWNDSREKKSFISKLFQKQKPFSGTPKIHIYPFVNIWGQKKKLKYKFTNF